MSDLTDHFLELDQDPDGWDYARCSCGWESPPSPGADIAAEFHADHAHQETTDA